MKSNPLLKWLLVPMVLLVLLVGLKLASGGHGAKTAPADPARLTPEEMKAVGVDGDTPRDTVATLVAQVKRTEVTSGQVVELITTGKLDGKTLPAYGLNAEGNR